MKTNGNTTSLQFSTVAENHFPLWMDVTPETYPNRAAFRTALLGNDIGIRGSAIIDVLTDGDIMLSEIATPKRLVQTLRLQGTTKENYEFAAAQGLSACPIETLPKLCQKSPSETADLYGNGFIVGVEPVYDAKRMPYIFVLRHGRRSWNLYAMEARPEYPWPKAVWIFSLNPKNI